MKAWADVSLGIRISFAPLQGRPFDSAQVNGYFFGAAAEPAAAAAAPPPPPPPLVAVRFTLGFVPGPITTVFAFDDVASWPSCCVR